MAGSQVRGAGVTQDVTQAFRAKICAESLLNGR
jgi:hypothetical protein